MFTPKWKKEARHLAKGALKFVHYKRDLLAAERTDEVLARRKDLLAAVAAGDRGEAEKASAQLTHVCGKALPAEKPMGWFEENVEVMFVAVVIALGLRAYYLQPFRIPTGSMQPTLNGIIGKPLPQTEWPSLPQRLVEKVLRGRSYVKVVNDRDRTIARLPSGPLGLDLRDVQKFHFLSRGRIGCTDAPPLNLPGPINPCLNAGLGRALGIAASNNMVLPAGTVVCEGTIDSGDLVLVNKFSYHFRKPKRGEVFVFDTIGIRGIHERSGDQAAGSHYIKRLCGTPGDRLSISPPNLFIDGRIAKEPGIQRVIRSEGAYHKEPAGYETARVESAHGTYLSDPDDVLELKAAARPGMREYAALGDNTANSLDSRYWGAVREFNLVGPALLSLWPLTTGHWGFIR
jgi:signal peptidase I